MRLSRALLGAVLCLLLAASTAWARPPVIAFLCLTEVDLQTFDGFRAGMAERGYRDGESVRFVTRDPVKTRDAIAPAITAFLKQGVDLLVTSSTQVSQIAVPLARETGVPVVFAPVNDPVAAGIVANLRRPGGNATGIRLPAGDDVRLQFLTLIAPEVRRVLLPTNPDDPSSRQSADTAVAAAEKLGLVIDRRSIGSADEVLALFADLPAGIDAVFLPRDSIVNSQIAAIVEATRRRRLPVSAPGIVQARQGALYSYGFIHFDIGRRAARLADQILRGIPAGDLPVETVENHLAVNLVTARAIGLSLSPGLLAQADVIINR